MPRKKQNKAQATPPQIAGEVWEIGRRALDVSVAELEQQGEQPEIVFVVQATEPGGVVFGGPLPASVPVTVLAEIVQQAMREPLLGAPRRPEIVRVGSPAEADVLRETLHAAGITLEVVSELEALEAVSSYMTQMLGGMNSDYRTRATQTGESLSNKGLRELFVTARQFYRKALWEMLDDTEIFAIELQSANGDAKTLYGVLMGMMAQEFGLVLYPSLDDLQQVYRLNSETLDFPLASTNGDPSDPDWEETTDTAAQILSVPCISLTYTPEQDMPPPLVQEKQRLKLPVANKSAYPLIVRTGQGTMQIATASDLRDMFAALCAILAWDEHLDQTDVEDEIDELVTLQLPTVADLLPALTVQITLIENPFAFDEDFDEDDEDEDEDDGELLEADFDALLESLQHALSARNAPAPHQKAPPGPTSKKTRKPTDSKTSHVYTLKVSLTDGPISEAYDGQEISRQIHILGHQTLHDLHRIIFEAFERWEQHLYEFNLGAGPLDRSQLYFYQGGWEMDEEAGDPQTTTLDELDLSTGQYFGYIFDMDDQWEHVIEILDIAHGPGEGTYPRIGERVGTSPPQYDEDEDEFEDDDER